MTATRSIHDLPGPRGLPLIGNSLQLLPLSRAHQRVEAWCDRYGPIFQFHAGRRRWVAIADQDELNGLLRGRPEGFRRLREMERAFEDPGFAGVFSVEGEVWKRQRRLVVRALNTNHLHRRYEVIQTATRRLRRRLREQAHSGGSFAITRLLTSFSVDVASALAFGQDLNTLERGEVELQAHIERVTWMLAFRSLFPFPYWRFFELPADRACKRSVEEVRAAVAGFIGQARAQMRQRPQLRECPENFLQAMLAAQKQEKTFTDAEIVGNVYQLLFAGEDTTAHTLAWTVWFLAQRPEIQARLAEESAALLGEAPCPADHEVVSRLDYCEAVLRESMRLKPVSVWDSYEPLTDTTICHTRIPAGTRITLLKRHVSRNAGGAEFDPDRWLDGGEREAPDQKSFLNFGAGPRFCPGRNLAFLEAKSALAMIARDFEIELDDSHGPVKESFSFTMVPQGLRVRLRERTINRPPRRGKTEEPTTGDPGYALSSSSEHEHERLNRQSSLYEPFTRRLLARAGIAPGMRVLDVGCGPGDVSFLLSEVVGAGGSVVGVERDEEALARARQRADESNVENVEFVSGDFRDVELAGEPFDALVGRFVLMYQADPVEAVRAAARHVRPGGVVAFAEMCLPMGSVAPEGRLAATWPRTLAAEQASKWCYATFDELGTHADMGMRLPATFAEAGLQPSPDLDAETAIAVGEDGITPIVDLARSLLPRMVAAGIATEEEVDIDTLAERLRVDTGPAGRVGMWPTAVSAHATKPSDATEPRRTTTHGAP